MENINELSLKLKNELINDLMTSPRNLDVEYLHVGMKVYSRRELANEIKNETEFGLEWLATSITVAINIIAKDSLKNK